MPTGPSNTPTSLAIPCLDRPGLPARIGIAYCIRFSTQTNRSWLLRSLFANNGLDVSTPHATQILSRPVLTGSGIHRSTSKWNAASRRYSVSDNRHRQNNVESFSRHHRMNHINQPESDPFRRPMTNEAEPLISVTLTPPGQRHSPVASSNTWISGRSHVGHFSFGAISSYLSMSLGGM